MGNGVKKGENRKSFSVRPKRQHTHSHNIKEEEAFSPLSPVFHLASSFIITACVCCTRESLTALSGKSNNPSFLLFSSRRRRVGLNRETEISSPLQETKTHPPSSFSLSSSPTYFSLLLRVTFLPPLPSFFHRKGDPTLAPATAERAVALSTSSSPPSFTCKTCEGRTPAF